MCSVIKILKKIDKICPKIQLKKRYDIENIKIKYNGWNDCYNLKIDKPIFNKKNESELCKYYDKIENKLNWIQPLHLCNNYVKDMMNFGGNINGMKTSLLIGDSKLGALIEDNNLEIGFSHFKSNWYYPLHCHKTEELYFILKGESKFGIEENESLIFKNKKPNDIIYHKSYQPHAMIFQKSEVLALYIWYRKGKYFFINT
jgi:hypothetical protein